MGGGGRTWFCKVNILTVANLRAYITFHSGKASVIQNKEEDVL